MSIHLMNQAWRTTLATGPKFVLVAICDTANEDGFCWPSVATISARCTMGERTVQRHLDDLEKAGIVTRSFRKGRSTNYQVHEAKFPMQTPANLAPPPNRHPRNNGTPANLAPTPATGDTTPPPNSTATPAKLAPRTTSKPKGKQKEPPNSARLASRVCVSLPDWLKPEAWALWEAHRIAVEEKGGAAWTQALADVSLRALEQRRAEGHDPAACIDASILGDWSGLYPPRKVDVIGAAMAANVPADWWKTAAGIIDRGRQLGILQREGQHFEQFKAKVFKAAGPGEWMEDMLRTVSRESEERGAQLYAFFNGLPRAGGAQDRRAA